MSEVSEKNDIKEIRKALRGIKTEIHKTNELLKLLWEFMHENPVIAVTLANHYIKPGKKQQGYKVTFNNHRNKEKYINHSL